MKNKILITAIAILAALFIFETGYLAGLNKNIGYSRSMLPRRIPLCKSDKDFSNLFAMHLKANQAFDNNINNMIKPQRLAAQPAKGLLLTSMMTSGETAKAYIITFNLPGFKKDEINVEVNRGRLTVFASSKKQMKKQKKGFYQEGSSSSNFVQSVKLPQNIIIKDILASYNLDTLTITIPKDREAKGESAAIIKVPVK